MESLYVKAGSCSPNERDTEIGTWEKLDIICKAKGMRVCVCVSTHKDTFRGPVALEGVWDFMMESEISSN